jgi:hypothetical protein
MQECNNFNQSKYDIYEHIHRFAAWAASRAASTKGHRFTVCDGNVILTKAKLREVLCGDQPFPEPEQMDAQHRKWRKAIIREAKRVKSDADFNDGIAAKLINVYLKAGLVTLENSGSRKIKALHPPIDRELLHCLEIKNESVNHDRAGLWRDFKNIGWSNFTSSEYEDVIRAIRNELGSESRLWIIEKYWPGFQR